ncbi:hypothetical protein TUM4438_34420 [Shewanella sairae]|uniref:General secretion pathway protein GspK n=1 Tax=Shewanella sairae TaxID=190310 RepID=A0ABQ4PN79_9GAMM|nr:type II secretion system protein GspK [Shewanella sairae]MCL1131408.1 type II secretion system protein GspK [Shewanella sairae]GIU49875.1 hypothetical protein TUM4438_34420 [Shewanella sairae]
MLNRYCQHGVALIQVLLLTAILSMMALQFTLSSRQQVTTATDLQNKMQAEVKLRTLESKLLFKLLTLSRNDVDDISKQDEIGKLWNFYGKPFSVGSGETVTIQDVNGLLSVYGGSNAAELEAYLVLVGASPQQAKSIVSNIKYWQGLDRDQYTTQTGNTVRGNYLLNVAELNSITGIDDALYQKLAPVVTTLQNILFNPITAPLPVLQVQLAPNVYEEVASLRSQGLLTKQRFTELTQIEENDSITFVPGRRLNIEITASVGSSVAKREFTVYLRPENQFPVVWFQ